MLYEENLKQAATAYKQKYTGDIQKYSVQNGTATILDKLEKRVAAVKGGDKTPVQAGDLTDAKRIVTELQHLANNLQGLKIPPMTFDAVADVAQFYVTKQQEVDAKKAKIEQEGLEQKQALEAEYQLQLKEAEDYNASLLEPVRREHERLLVYKDDLAHVFERYDITPLDCGISEDISAKDFQTMVQGAVTVCDKYIHRDQGSFFRKILSPLKDNPNLGYTFGYVFLGCVLLYLALPIIALPVFFLFCYTVHSMYDDMENLRLACALMASFDYEKFIPDSERKRVAELDTSAIDSLTQERISKLDDVDAEKSKALSKLAGDTHINDVCKQNTVEVQALYKNALQNVSLILQRAQTTLEEVQKLYKAFPDHQNLGVIMGQTPFVLARTLDGVDVDFPLPATNYVFDNSDPIWSLQTLKLFFANTLLSVKPKNLTVEVVDPIRRGSEFVDFFSPEASDYVKRTDYDLNKSIEAFHFYFDTAGDRLLGKSITDYNTEAARDGKVELKYHLIVYLSGLEKFLEIPKKRSDGADEQEDPAKVAFFEQLKFSADRGVYVWFMCNREFEGTTFVTKEALAKPGTVPIVYNTALGSKAMKIYLDALAHLKPSGLPYMTYIDAHWPLEKWWTKDSIKSIEFHPGRKDGDPTDDSWNNDAEKFYDGCVHGLLAGVTGAGKSVAINQAIMTMIAQYPPSELQLAFVDFKNVEAAKFARGYFAQTGHWNSEEEDLALKRENKFFRRVCRIPHMKLLAGTTDGEYALSVFNYLNNEMKRRQKIIDKAGKTKIEEVRKDVLNKYNAYKGTKGKTWAEMRRDDWDWYKVNVIDTFGGELPRLVFIFDEFQVMFNPAVVDNKTQGLIMDLITNIVKLARAMSVHLWFTSQSMKGTLSKDVLDNFTLRMCLRATKDISQEVLGNDASGTITDKFGYMYSNTDTSHDKRFNKLWKVPFFPHDEDLLAEIDKLYPLLITHNEQHDFTELYDEKQLIPSTVMDEWYERRPEIADNKRLLILGEPTDFSEDKSPVNIVLQDDDGENMLLSAFEREVSLNLILTIVNNIRKHPGVHYILNCADPEMGIMMDLDNICDPAFKPFSGHKADYYMLLTALMQEIEKRKASNKTEFEPLYLIGVCWERVLGIGIEVPRDAADEKVKAMKNGFTFLETIIRDGPSVGLHTIMLFRDFGDISTIRLSGLKHRLCGYCNDKNSSKASLVASDKVSKLPTIEQDKGVFAIYEFGPKKVKLRVYQHEFAKKPPERSFSF